VTVKTFTSRFSVEKVPLCFVLLAHNQYNKPNPYNLCKYCP